jgi:hypothetical protein
VASIKVAVFCFVTSCSRVVYMVNFNQTTEHYSPEDSHLYVVFVYV